MPSQWIIAILFGLLVSLLAWRLGALSLSGAAAAALVGILIFGSGGLPWAALLLAFFISSSALSRFSPKRKQAAEEKYAKGSRRDWGQVLANGGVGALLALAHALQPAAIWPWLAFAGAMAAVNADTWATELGVLNPGLPRLITNGKRVERGTSGAISPVGYLAALVGALLIALIAWVLPGASPGNSPGFSPGFSPGYRLVSPTILLSAISLAGLAGSTVDSLLGATLQAIYWCPSCQKETERHPLHSCGSPTSLYHGWGWLNNDMVNFICSLVGAGVAAAVFLAKVR